MYTRILVFLTVFLKNRNISSKIKRSKVTDYAALNKANSFDTKSLFLDLDFSIKHSIVSSKIYDNGMALILKKLFSQVLIEMLLAPIPMVYM